MNYNFVMECKIEKYKVPVISAVLRPRLENESVQSQGLVTTQQRNLAPRGRNPEFSHHGLSLRIRKER